MAAPRFSIQWDAHEYEHKERSSDWFWAMGIVTVAAAITSVILGNVIFAILVIIGAFALTLFINREPNIMHVEINEKGITRGRIHYPYSTLHSFWVDDEPPQRRILIRSRRLFMPLLLVPLGDEIDGARIERTLERFLEREFHTLPMVEKVLEYLGF